MPSPAKPKIFKQQSYDATLNPFTEEAGIDLDSQESLKSNEAQDNEKNNHRANTSHDEGVGSSPESSKPPTPGKKSPGGDSALSNDDRKSKT